MFYAMEQALKRAFPLRKAFHKDRFAQWFPLCVAGCSALAAFPLTFASSDNAALFYTFVTVPIVCILFSFFHSNLRADSESWSCPPLRPFSSLPRC